MAIRVSRIDTAAATLDELAGTADANHDGRVSSTELKQATAQASPAETSAAFAVWRDAYDRVGRSPMPRSIRSDIGHAVDALVAADVNHNGIVTNAELATVTSETAQRVAAYAASLSASSGSLSLTAARAALSEALRSSLGVDVSPTITQSTAVNGTPRVRFLASNGEAEVDLLKGPGGSWMIKDARLISAPTVVDPELKSSFEDQLAGSFGFIAPEVKAVGHAPSTATTTRWQLQVESGPTNARRTEQVQLEYTGANPAKRTAFKYDEASAKEQAVQLVTDASLDLARQFGSPLDVLGQLEVFFKRDAVSDTDVQPVALQDSPIGFDPATEVQFSVPPLVGDNVGYATFNKKTGTASADTFN